MTYIVRKVGLEVVNEVYIQKGIILLNLDKLGRKKFLLFKIVLLGLISTNLLDILWEKAEILQKILFSSDSIIETSRTNIILLTYCMEVFKSVQKEIQVVWGWTTNFPGYNKKKKIKWLKMIFINSIEKTGDWNWTHITPAKTRTVKSIVLH